MVGLIEIRLRERRQLFDSLDPTPFPGRDLDHDAARFIVGWAREYPQHLPLAIRIHFEQPAPDDLQLSTAAIHNYFAMAADASKRDFRLLMSIGRRSLLVGIAFLAACLSAADWLDTREALPRVLGLLRESLLIVGWVALWRPLEIFLYDWWPLRSERKLYERLARATVELP